MQSAHSTPSSLILLYNLTVCKLFSSLQGKIIFPATGSGDGFALSVNCGTMAAWASRRRLCLAASFLQAAKEAAAKLVMTTGDAPVRQMKVSQTTHVKYYKSVSFNGYSRPFDLGL